MRSWICRRWLSWCRQEGRRWEAAWSAHTKTPKTHTTSDNKILKLACVWAVHGQVFGSHPQSGPAGLGVVDEVLVAEQAVARGRDAGYVSQIQGWAGAGNGLRGCGHHHHRRGHHHVSRGRGVVAHACAGGHGVVVGAGGRGVVAGRGGGVVAIAGARRRGSGRWLGGGSGGGGARGGGHWGAAADGEESGKRGSEAGALRLDLLWGEKKAGSGGG